MRRGAEGSPSHNGQWEDEDGVADRVPDHCHRLAIRSKGRGIKEIRRAEREMRGRV
jgi:hypothetical protein